MEVLKLNFDASITNDAAAAFLIWDYYGHLLRGGRKKLPPCSVPNAELSAIWMAIKVAI